MFILFLCVFYLHNVCLFFFSILPNFFDHNVFLSPKLFFSTQTFFYEHFFSFFPIFPNFFFETCFFFTPTFFFLKKVFFPMTPDLFYVMKTMLLFFD